MKTPAQVTGEIRSRLEKRWHLAIAGADSGDWPFRAALGTPPKAALEADFQTARTWARTWDDWATAHKLTLDWRTRIVLGTTQPLPSHLTVPDIEIAARVCGQNWPTRLARARHRLALLKAAFPQADHAKDPPQRRTTLRYRFRAAPRRGTMVRIEHRRRTDAAAGPPARVPWEVAQQQPGTHPRPDWQGRPRSRPSPHAGALHLPRPCASRGRREET